MRPIQRLTILYDSACGLCTNVRHWLMTQTQAVSLEFVAAGSAEARARFSGIPAGELAVIADSGEVWLGNHAWVVCLWALRDYRGLAVRLSSPLLLLMAREAFSLVSNNRAEVSQWLGLRSDAEIEQQLRRVHAPACAPAGVEEELKC